MSDLIYSLVEGEEWLFENIPEGFLEPDNYLQKVHDLFEKKLVALKEDHKAVATRFDSKLQSLQVQISKHTEDINELRGKRSSYQSKILKIDVEKNELCHRKNVLRSNNVEVITPNELTELFDKVLAVEKENEIRKEDMNDHKKILISKMVFYKEYLDVYVDVVNKDYTFYFKWNKGLNTKFCPHWIKLSTDNFKEYFFADVSLPNGSDEKLALQKTYSQGTYLRGLILLSRKILLGSNDITD